MSTAHPIRVRDDGRMYESLSFASRPAFDPKRAAVVVVDMIHHQLREGRTCLSDLKSRGVPTDYYKSRIDQIVVPAHQRLLPAARAAGAGVVFLRIGCYRTDFADAIEPLRESFRNWDARDGQWGCDVDDRIETAPGDISLIKTGSGGFATSNLDSHLRNMGAQHVFYTGVVTNGCVLLTLSGGYDRNYVGYLVSDATATFSPQLQTSTEDIIAGFMAPVVEADSAIEMLQRGAAA
jgi:nicotinamidase-related amidase